MTCRLSRIGGRIRKLVNEYSGKGPPNRMRHGWDTDIKINPNKFDLINTDWIESALDRI
jgi:hypothetical protein